MFLCAGQEAREAQSVDVQWLQVRSAVGWEEEGWALQAAAVPRVPLALAVSPWSPAGRTGVWNIPVLWKSHSSALAEFGRARLQFSWASREPGKFLNVKLSAFMGLGSRVREESRSTPGVLKDLDLG